MAIPGDYIMLKEDHFITKEDLVPVIPPIADVADKGQDAVPQVPDRVDFADILKIENVTFDESAPMPERHYSNHHPIDHPHHYQGDGMEVIDVIEAFDLGFCLGNAVKYVLRAGKKDDVIQDLRKAIWNINRRIQQLEKA